MKIPYWLVLLMAWNGFTYCQQSPVQTNICNSNSGSLFWTPGIPGGIPHVDAPVVSVLDFKADPEGKADNHDAFQKAIDALPATGGVVYVPAGTYRLASGITIKKNNVVIRGDGPQCTRLLMDFKGDCFEVYSDENSSWQKLSSNIPMGTNNISAVSESCFIPGEFAEIQQENDSSVMYTQAQWIQDWAENAVGQLFEVKSVRGDTLDFETNTHIAFEKRLQVSIRPLHLIRYVGFENFYIEKLQADGNTFSFQNAAYCWISNVESYHTRKSHIELSTTIGCVVRDSYFHHSFDYGGGGSGYGIACNHHATDNLIENNVFYYLRHAMLVQIGSNGNVFGYNYSTSTVQGAGESNLNQGWIPPDISVHGHYPFMNLFESNDVQEIGISDFWGPAGPDNTFLRNRVTGEGIFIYDHSHYQILLGNSTPQISNEQNSSHHLIEQGNVVDSMEQRNENPDRLLPSSLYLNQKPSFLGNAGWPVFGPDVRDNQKLPAQIRFEKLQSGSH